MDLGLLYKAIEQTQVDMIAASATDGLLSKMDLQILEDDKHAFPSYELSFVAREAILAEKPEMRAAQRTIRQIHERKNAAVELSSRRGAINRWGQVAEGFFEVGRIEVINAIAA